MKEATSTDEKAQDTMKKLLAGSIAAFALTAVGAAHAQEAPAPPPPGGGFGGPPPGGGPGGGRFGGPGGGRFGRGQQVATLANAPIEALTAGLKLTGDQTQKIKDIQATVRPQGGRGGFGGGPGGGGFGGPGGGGPGGPPPGGGQGGPPPGGGGGQGGQPDFAAMRQQMQQAEQKAVSQIEAVLTDEQKPLVPGVLKDIQTLRTANIPAELMGTLKLTSDQMTKLADVGAKSQKAQQAKMQEIRDSGDFGGMRQAMDDARVALDKDVDAVLTSEQAAQVKAFKKAHPQPQGGGFGGGRGGFGGGPGGGGGFGGPGGGGPGGPPPGGPGGPPPQF